MILILYLSNLGTLTTSKLHRRGPEYFSNVSVNGDLRLSKLDFKGYGSNVKKFRNENAFSQYSNKPLKNKLNLHTYYPRHINAVDEKNINDFDYDIEMQGRSIEEAIEDVIILPELIQNSSKRYGTYQRSHYHDIVPKTYHPANYNNYHNLEYNSAGSSMNNGGNRGSLMEPLFLMATLSFITFLVNSILGLLEKIRMPVVRARLDTINSEFTFNDFNEIVNFLNQTFIN